MGKTKTAALMPICTLALGMLATPLSASAQANIAAAKTLFDQGLSEMEAGQYASGCPKLSESLRLDRRPGTLFTTAECAALWGRIATAVTRYEEFLRWYKQMTPADQEKQADRAKIAEAKRAELAPWVPKLTIQLAPDAPSGTVVRHNGEVLGEGAFNTPLPVDPGEQTLSTQAPGGELTEQKIELNKGESKLVELKVKPAPVGGVASPSGTSSRRTAAYISMGLGGASIVAGGILGGLVLGKKKDLDAHCGPAVGQSDTKTCDDIGIAAAQSIDGPMGIAAPLLVGLGVAGLATGVILFVTEPKAETPSATTSKWVRLGMLDAGTTGMIFGAQGKF